MAHSRRLSVAKTAVKTAKSRHLSRCNSHKSRAKTHECYASQLGTTIAILLKQLFELFEEQEQEQKKKALDLTCSKKVVKVYLT